MINTILNAKNWQLFLLTFGIPLILLVLFSVNLLIRMTNNLPLDAGYGEGFTQIFPIIFLFSSMILYLWYRAVGLGLQKLMPKNVQLKVGRFRAAWAYLLIYSVLYVVFFGNLIFELNQQNLLGSIGPENLILMVFPFHILAMLSAFYCLYFVAKTFCTVEKQRAVSFSEFAAEFFLIWFFPIGIWFLQPRINRLALRHKSKQTSFV